MNQKRNIILLILDGLGIGESNISNPFRFTKTTTIDFFKKNYPYCLLSASGITVGLPDETPGNCEIGHLSLGTGIVYYQNLTKIDLAIANGNFFKDKKLVAIINHVKKFNSSLHLIGLLSSALTKASFNHLLSLLKFCAQENFSRVYLHLFSDGIDSPPRSALNLVQHLKTELEKNNLPGKISTMCGRFYALDETGNYSLKTQKVFLLLVEGIGKIGAEPTEVLKEKYQDLKFNDAFLDPFIFDKNGTIKDNDAVLFFNFENKSIFQLAEAFLDPNFQKFKRPERHNLIVASLTRYLENIDYPIIFEEQKIINNLSRVLAENNLKQLKIIDEPRKNLIRFYFNGFIEENHPNEIYKFFPAFEIDLEKIIAQGKEMIDYLIFVLQESDFDFIVMNLAVLDLIGHKGDFREAIKIIEIVDEWLKEIFQACLEKKFDLIITSDHGNIEKMVNPKTGQLDTGNNNSPVPFWLISRDFKLTKERSLSEVSLIERKIWGSLIDVPVTITALFSLPQPPTFIGKNLIPYITSQNAKQKSN